MESQAIIVMIIVFNSNPNAPKLYILNIRPSLPAVLSFISTLNLINDFGVSNA